MSVSDSGFVTPCCFLERWYDRLALGLLYVSLGCIALLALPICFDIISRTWFHYAVDGVTEIETYAMTVIGFAAMPYITATKSHIAIDILFERFGEKAQRRLTLFAWTLSAAASGLLAWEGTKAAQGNVALTQVLMMPEWPFMLFSALCLWLVCLGFCRHALHEAAAMLRGGDALGVALALATLAVLCILPFVYKASGLRLSRLTLGGAGFALLFALLLLRVPIGLAMAAMGIMGLLCIMRTPAAAFSLVASVPFRESCNFVLVAIPMFMLMGELASKSGISRDMFNCANKWLGRMPGGLACAAVGGCAGFGAICGESLPTVITMSTVALPVMRESGYSPSLSCGALAAGGTLGILIPPSMGFIFYSIMTENSVGQLFMAGIMPGLLLSAIFMLIIYAQARRNPSLAPRSPAFSLPVKLRSLTGLVPMVLLFSLVVGGILGGVFTPGEGGAVGAAGAFLYGVARRQLNFAGLAEALRGTALMTGKIFVILAGVYVFGAFLTSSRLPALLADFVVGLDMNRYVVLFIVIGIYIILGCAMTIMPMMLLTLPSIYPTIAALGFDGIWFGVITVIVMEMGLITPPVGMNVFTLASLAPDVPMASIFRGVLPFFFGMCLCVLLIVLFPSLALWLPGML